jgi:hypothetical protein
MGPEEYTSAESRIMHEKDIIIICFKLSLMNFAKMNEAQANMIGPLESVAIAAKIEAVKNIKYKILFN